MDIFHLPPALRRAIFTRSSHRRRSITTQHAVDSYTAPSPSSQALLSLSSGTLNSYNLSIPPSPSDLKEATSFFTRHAPTLLFSAAHFRSFPPSPFPEVAFLGRSNVGKSSLLNALIGRPNDRPAHVSKRPGRTKTMNGFGIGADGVAGAKKQKKTTEEAEHGIDPAWKGLGRGGLVVVDMPGYGAASREEWGAEILKYLRQRRQLRRSYVLVDTEHGLKASDVSLLLHLRRNGIPHQIVLSKVDKLLYPRSRAPGAEGLHHRLLRLRDTCAEMRDTLDRAAGEAGGRRGRGDVSLLGDILCCSAEKSLEERGRRKRIGIDEIRWSVLTACGLDGAAAAGRREGGRRADEPEEVDQEIEERVRFSPS